MTGFAHSAGDHFREAGHYIKQALEGIRQKLANWKSDQIPTYSRPESVVVNDSPDHAVRFDLEANAVEVLGSRLSDWRRRSFNRQASNFIAGA